MAALPLLNALPAVSQLMVVLAHLGLHPPGAKHQLALPPPCNK